MRNVLIGGLLALSIMGADLASAASAQEYLRSAQKYLNEGEVNAAVIELKNSLDERRIHARHVVRHRDVRDRNVDGAGVGHLPRGAS